MNNVDIGVIKIYIPDYNKLVNENEDLKKENIKLKERITDLSSQITSHIDSERLYKETIINHEQTIEELRNENKLLKLKIQELETKIILQENKIKHLEDHITKQYIKIELLENKEIYKKYIIAIQDLNKIEGLESKLYHISKTLIKLRKHRVSECHYLNEDDDEWFIVDRKSVLYDKLINIPDKIKQKINKLFPNVIENVIDYIKPAKIVVSYESLEEINTWWND